MGILGILDPDPHETLLFSPHLKWIFYINSGKSFSTGTIFIRLDVCRRAFPEMSPREYEAEYELAQRKRGYEVMQVKT